MREHDAAARRMVVGGAVVLAAALAALVLAGAAVGRLDREAGRRDAANRLRADVAFSLHWVARGAPDDWTEFLDARFVPLGGGDDGVVPPPRPFDLLPEARDAEARFLLEEADGDGPPALRRAALRLAAKSPDPAARLSAAARLAANDGPAAVAGLELPQRLAATREAVLVGLLRGDAGARVRAEQAIGTEDDASAASLLIASAGANEGDAIARVVWLRSRAAQLARLSAALAALPDRVGPSGAVFRGGLLDDGSCVAGVRLDVGRWAGRLLGAGTAEPRLRSAFALRGLRVVGPEAPRPAEGAVVETISPGWSAVSDASLAATPERTGTVLAGLAVAALAAVTAYAVFVRAVRREARAAAARADFVATVSHELRTPVAVVRTSAETLLAGRAPREEDRTTLLQAIVRETERLSALLGNVLDFARIDAGTRRYAFRDVAIRDLVEETVRRTAPALAASGYRVDAEIPADPGALHADPDALAAALANLLDNAAKYRGTSDRATVRVAAAPGVVTIEVEDRGVGIPDREKPHVFERFFRGADATVRETRGSGIGLALVRHAVEAHGGRVEVSDTPGGGATFRIVLPRRGRE